MIRINRVVILFIAVIVLISVNSFSYALDKNTIAENSEKIVNEELSDSGLDNKELETLIYEDNSVKKVTSTLYTQIQNQMKDISMILINIEDKLKLARNMQEYITYPAIRLDIDTPFFGIEHIINSKLTIHEGVSTFDVASGYDIKDVINKKKFKLATFDIASVVVLTRDVDINEEMTLEDAKQLTVKLVEYYNQAKQTSKLLDDSLSDKFKNYLSDEKDNLIKTYNSKVDESKNLLNDINKEIAYVMNFSDFNEELLILNNYYMQMFKNREISEDMLLSVEQMTSNIESINLELESITKFKENVKFKRDTVLEDIKLDVCVLNVLNDLKENLKYIDKYKEDSITVTKKEILGNKDNIEENKENSEDNKTNDVNKKFEDVTTINYLTTSDNIYDSIKENIKKLESIYDDIVIYYYNKEAELKNKEELNKETNDNNNLINSEINKNLQKDSITDEINIYNYNDNEKIKEYIEKVNSIMLDIYNKKVVYMTNNIQANVKNIKSNNNLNVYEYLSLKYIYYEMQVELDVVYNIYDNKDVIKVVNSSEKLEIILSKIIEANNKLLKEVSED